MANQSGAFYRVVVSRGMTFPELAKRLGVSLTAIHTLSRRLNQGNRTYKRLDEVCQCLGLTRDEFEQMMQNPPVIDTGINWDVFLARVRDRDPMLYDALVAYRVQKSGAEDRLLGVPPVGAEFSLSQRGLL